MSYQFKTVAASILRGAGLALVPAVYAEQSSAPDTNRSHMAARMRQGGMMGMPDGMMRQTSGVMEGCSALMQGRSRPPNRQFHQQSEPPQQE